MAQPEPPAEPEPQPQVVAVEVRVPPGTDTSGLDLLVVGLKEHPLSRRSVRRTLQLLFATGRFADVVVREAPVAGGVKLTFEVVGKRAISDLSVEGNRVLSNAEVLEAGRLAEGGEFYPEMLQQAVDGIVGAYRRRGYDSAEVHIEKTEAGGSIQLLLSVTEGRPTQVAAIVVAGHPGLPLSRLLDVLGLPVGAVLERGRLEQGIERLRELLRRERFYRAQVGEPIFLPRANGVLVQLPITTGPRYALQFHGNRSFGDTLLRSLLGYDGTERLDEAVIARMIRRLTTFYRLRGFHEARVLPREVERLDGEQAVLTFEIQEGPPIRVEHIAFDGNQALKDKELEWVVGQQILARLPQFEVSLKMLDEPLQVQGRTSSAGAVEAPMPEPATVLLEDAYADAAESMVALYRERGYPQAWVQLRDVEVDLERGRARVSFHVFEGAMAIVQRVSIDGLPAGMDLGNVLVQKAGNPLSASQVERSRTNVLSALAREGHLFAKVEPDTRMTPDGTGVQLVFRANPGPRVEVGRVLIQGAVRTSDALVRASLKFRSGDTFNPDKLAESERALVLLGIFRQVAVRMLTPEEQEQTKDVVVELKERGLHSGEFGGGYSLVDGPRAVADAVLPNLFGQGINLSGRGKISYVNLALRPPDTSFAGLGGRGNIALQQPRIYQLLPIEVGARADLIAERVFRPGFLFTRYAAVAGLDYTPLRWLNVALQYELERDQVETSRFYNKNRSDLSRADQERLRFDPGVFALQTLRSVATVDLRDDPANPQSGVFFTTTGELTRDIYACVGDVTYCAEPNERVFTFKVSGNLTAYLKLAPRVVLALSARGGRFFFPSADTTTTLAPKRFFLGGTTSMRGFREDGLISADRREQLASDLNACQAVANKAGCTQDAKALLGGIELASEGGQLFTLGRAELRFPVFSAFDLGLFGEAGNLWFDTRNYRPLELRYVAGAGLRYGTPIGPLAFDVGFNLFPDYLVNEPAFNLNFSIGLF